MALQKSTRQITGQDFADLLDRADIEDSDFLKISGTRMWELQALLHGRDFLNMAEILLLEMLAAGVVDCSYLVNLSKQFTEKVDIGPTRKERRSAAYGGRQNA
jgi:hypothetical protein